MPKKLKKAHFEELVVDKFIYGGQAVGSLDSGQKVLVLGALPGENVRVEIKKSHKNFVEGVVSEVITGSESRISPRDPSYLSTSPWQVLKESEEDQYKSQILIETFMSAKVELMVDLEFEKTEDFWHYRNKMEYSFFGDEDGLRLALYNRGSHQKQIISGSSIARPEIDQVAVDICGILDRNNIRASDLKTIILRCSSTGEVVAALFTKNRDFPKILELGGVCKGLIVVYSNPKSPASVRTKDLYQFGDITLVDKVFSADIKYNVFSFFQVNIPVFKLALRDIKNTVMGDKLVDMYSGVGTIGVAIPGTRIFVESDIVNVEFAKNNVPKGSQVVLAQSENALDYILPDHAIIVDPPRAGLHTKLVDRLLEVLPPKIVYLSCNPVTQARDVKLLEEKYKVEFIKGYNFFPRTPHIESLCVLTLAEGIQQ